MGRRWVRAAGAALATGPAVFAMAGCGIATPGAEHAAAVRFVNASVDAPAMDLYLNGSGAAYGVGFGTVTSYIPLLPGETKVSLLRANTGQTLMTATRTLVDGQRYTAVAGNVLGSLDETVYGDRQAAAPAGELAVRVLNEDADAGPLNIFVTPVGAGWAGAVPLARGLAYVGASPYTDLPAGAIYALSVTQAGVQPSASTRLRGALLQGGSGAVRTVVLAGTPGRGDKGLTGFVLEDSDTP